MKAEIKELIDISKFYGNNKDYVIAGGGNTSFKDNDTIWIKASGQPLAELEESGLVALSRQKLAAISTSNYPEDPVEREEKVKNDLFSSVLNQETRCRPSLYTFIQH
jgi:rhamnose utilization protein RhaD (predicted bifunctional aldolase and dehydrogenase)